MVIISSPGLISNAPRLAINPDVQEFTLIEYLTLKNLHHKSSNFRTSFPPRKNLFFAATKPESTPDFITFTTDFISLLSIELFFLNL